MAVDQVIPPTWRRHTVPRCPSCKRGAVNALHRSCDGALYVDMATGRVHCTGCGRNWAFTNWKSYCRCGAVFKGGELWEGMKAEMGQAGEFSWLKVQGRRKGTLKTTMLGWSFCVGCGEERDVETGLLQTGLPGGGICEVCSQEAQERFTARYRFRYRSKKNCSWCDRGWTGPIYKVGIKKRLCWSCFWDIDRQVKMLAERERSKPRRKRRRKTSAEN
jgi:hypothetical protein